MDGIVFERDVNLECKVVLIDGIARCGKSMISPILSSCKAIEIERLDGIFDQIAIGHFFGGISTNAAISMIKSAVDENIYNSYLSRNTNFRPSDHSSVFKSSNAWTYLRRLFRSEGQDVVQSIRESGAIYQHMVHDNIRFIDLHFEAFGERLFFVEIIRHPIELIDAWWRRGWGERFGLDPLSLTPCIKSSDGSVPFYAAGWQDEYEQMPPMDRIIYMMHDLFRYNREGYERLIDHQKEQVLVIRFEDFVQNSRYYVDEICKKLGTEPTSRTNKAIRAQNCPRDYSVDSHAKMLSNINDNASTSSQDLLHSLIDDYSRDWK